MAEARAQLGHSLLCGGQADAGPKPAQNAEEAVATLLRRRKRQRRVELVLPADFGQFCGRTPMMMRGSPSTTTLFPTMAGSLVKLSAAGDRRG